MELHVLDAGKATVVLLDNDMKIVKPVYDFLRFQQQKSKADNTLLANGRDVHLLMEVDPQFGIHRAVKTIKGKTSRVLRSEFATLWSRLPSLWTNSYFVSTVGGAPLSAIKQYIENQKYV